MTGLLLWFASPAVGVAPVAWVAIAPAAAVAVAGGRAGRLAVPVAYTVYLELLLVPALPFSIADGQWAEPSIPVLIAGSPVLAVALVGIPLFAGALYLVGFGTPLGAQRLAGACGTAAAVVVPALAWTALDFARANLDPAGSWGPLYQSQAATAAGGLAALGGPWLVTLTIVLVNYGLATAIVRRSRASVAFAAAILAAGVALAPLGGASDDDAVLRVSAVQPPYDTADENHPDLRRFEPGSYRAAALDLIEAFAAPTLEAGRRGAQLVVWPEAAMFVDPRDHPHILRALSRLARKSDAALVVGWFDARTARSAMVLVASDGRVSPAQPKQRPMWFLGEGALDAPPEPVTVGEVRVGTLLGLDIQDPGVAADLARRDARVIASPTHDWEQLATQQRASTRIAARATGLPVVRANWRFGSALYDSRGEPVADAGGERRDALLIADVGAGAPTFYARAGDFLAWLAVAVTVLIGAASMALRAFAPSPIWERFVGRESFRARDPSGWR